jgi:phage anti-repressor protein
VSNSFISQSAYSSALRFGLSPIKSVEETYVDKIGKFKLIHKITRLVPKQQYSYKDYAALFYEDVLRNISTSPKFQEEEIYNFLIERSLNVLEESGLKDRIERLEELQKDASASSVEEQHAILIDMAMELSSIISREEESRFYAGTFLKSSNFQLSYFAELMRGSQAYKKFLNVMQYELRILRGYVRASIQRSPQAAMRRHNERRKELRPLVDTCDIFRVASMSLKTYVEICNSERVDQLFEPKPLDAKKLDKEQFQRLFSNYISKLEYLEDKIFERKPEIFTTKIDFNQPINSMWKKLVIATATS